MQTKMFVFVGLSDQNTFPELSTLLKTLNESALLLEHSILFTLSDKLLRARFNDVSYYISYMKSKEEIADWIQLANDSELSGSLLALTENSVDERYNQLKRSHPDLYTDIHFLVAKQLFREMSMFSDLRIISFQ